MANTEAEKTDATTVRQVITEKMTNTEFCSAFDLSTVTAWRYRAEGLLPYCRIGGKIFYLPQHIEEFLKRTSHRTPTKRRSKSVA